MKTLVQWGAGNIGRSFIGQVFGRNGCRVIFVDVNDELIRALSESGRYNVVFISSEGEETITVSGIEAVHAADTEKLNKAILEADYLSFSVGKNILPKAAPQAAAAIARRYSLRPESPLDIIIAENVHGGAALMRSLLSEHLPPDIPLESYLGFVETSLGKMVPIQSGEDLLTVYAEPFNTLILDRNGFRGELPDFPEIKAVEPIAAYVAEKLYIHNLGHAAAAYLGYRHNPEIQYIWEVMEDPSVRGEVKRAMEQAGEVLRTLYPGVFTAREIAGHIDDLLGRFANRALGDSVFRVGRDLRRKLHKDDRLMGAIIHAEEHKLPWDAIGRAYRAGLGFRCTDGNGELFPADRTFLADLSDLEKEARIARAADFTEAERRCYEKTIITPLISLTDQQFSTWTSRIFGLT
jgi:mannitol-1-phosphate 5-dehydrogenase